MNNVPLYLTINHKSYSHCFCTPKFTHNNEWSKILAVGHNKNMHSKNGNFVINNLKVIQFNTGNGNWMNNNFLLLLQITRHKPDIISISQSNIYYKDSISIQRQRSLFRDYIFMDKIFQNMSNARLTVMIKSNLDIIRMTRIENDISRRRRWCY